MIATVTLIPLFLFGIAVCDNASSVDWSERARNSQWSWPDQEPSLFLSTMDTNEPYQVLLEHIHSERFLVHIRRDDKLRFKFEAHSRTPFTRCRHRFLYADFGPDSSGCTIIAYDLEARKQIWKTRLKGIGPVRHTRYSNRVSLGITHGVIQIHGLESNGKYIEYLDLVTGELIGHRVFDNTAK